MLWGHKWNSEPDLVQYFYSKYWRKYAKLERINTLDYKIGFDFILRKNGRFRAFEEKDHLKNYSGRLLFEEGRMAGQNFRQ
jgi:hypothetical protein